MGQTLPNGIYLPAEGERNCYDGLEGNWRSLDSLISTVAGKASATHTHGNITNDGKVGTTANLPLITGTGGAVQAGSFGTAANTFCEGNDSRLSDARTPVAHTHTKSDVTDLLNSNFIPSANNSYDLGTSTNKWKTLNGINPGALSFPRIVSADSRTFDTTNWDYTGTNWNTLDTSAMTGWGYIYIENCSATDFILIRRGATNFVRPTQSTNPVLDNNGKYYLYITFPIVQNTNTYTLIRTSGTVKTSVVYPCQGTILNS